MNKKGFVLTLDAVIAIIFVSVIFILISSFLLSDSSETTKSAFINMHFVSEDVLDVMNKQGLLDEISTQWVGGNKSNATNISRYYLDRLIPEGMGYRLEFDGNTIAQNNRVPEKSAIAQTHSVRLLVGFSENKTVVGNVARAFLTGIEEKTSSVYAYFGGFVGQGNLTRYLDVPSGVNILSAYMEMDAGGQFNMFVNTVPCNNPHTPSGGNLSADIQEDISSCAFTNGQNTLRIEFTSDIIDEQFIGGGFVRVTYNTSQFNETSITGSDRYEFPGIEGIINHFSSFYVPGTLNSMNIHLDFYNNFSTFLRVGDTLVFNSSGSSGLQTVDLDNNYLSSKLNYGSLSEKTIPIRMTTTNITGVEDVGIADVILITDLSGSMDWKIGYSSGSGEQRDCDDPNLYDNDTKRISLAKCLDKQFVDIIFNTTGNRVGLVGFNTDADIYHDLSNDSQSVLDYIDNYPDSPSGGTCICCAINRAYGLLSSQSSPERNKYIIVMSDGVTGYCCGETGWWWWTECDEEGTNTDAQYWDCGGGSSDCFGSQCDGAINNAIWSSNRSHEDLDVTVNSVGFGPVATCENGNFTLRQIAAVGNGTYCSSTDPVELESCYVDFAQDILDASIRSQLIELTGNAQPTYLYPSSYIEYNFTPAASLVDYGEITLSYDTDRFNDGVNCEGDLVIPSDVEVIDAKATSYSSEHWTHYLSIDNSLGLNTLFQLSDFGNNYYALGDPYIVNILPSAIRSGETNTIKVTTGDSETNETGCSLDNRAILTIKLAGAINYGDVFLEAEGCNWEIEFEDGDIITAPFPSTYNGSSQCSYTSSLINFTDDAMADAIYRSISKLDLEKDGEVNIKFDPSQILFDLGDVGGVRSLWGPAKLKLVVWL